MIEKIERISNERLLIELDLAKINIIKAKGSKLETLYRHKKLQVMHELISRGLK